MKNDALINSICVGTGAVAGALSRYKINEYAKVKFGAHHGPWSIAAINIVATIISVFPIFKIQPPTIHTKAIVNSKVAIVIPDTGELDDPTTPAMYPATAAKKNETTAKNNAPASAIIKLPVAYQ